MEKQERGIAKMNYTVKSVAKVPCANCDWNEVVWDGAEVASLESVRPESSEHHPKVQVKVVHDEDCISGIFNVEDRYVRVLHTHYQDMVCTDSCVEFFIKPSVGNGYFNLEMNAGGAFLLYYVKNHQVVGEAYKEYIHVAPEHGSLLTVKTSLPPVVEPEIAEPTTWQCQFVIPRAALEPYCGPLGRLSGQTWKCNFYKCGDKTSHPHWISWAPVPILNFHLPDCFKDMILL